MFVNIATIVLSVAALVLSVMSYRYAKSVKAIDLRIEVNKAREDARQALIKLRQSHSRALSARTSLNAARGLLGSGAMEKYEKSWKANGSLLGEIEAQLAEIPVLVSWSDSAQLERAIITMHKIRTQVDAIQNQYDADFAYNERERPAPPVSRL